MEEERSSCPGLVGLTNLGNTCYMNAILQCLCNLPELVEYFLSDKYKTAPHLEYNESATAFGSLLADMWQGGSACVSPESFHSVFGKQYPIFSEKMQHDAQEFLICLLNELHESLMKPSTSWAPEAEASASSGTGTSIISQLFEGQLSYNITCLKCKATTDRLETFTILSLPIPSKTTCSLQDCLKCFFKYDRLTKNNRVHCLLCGTKQDAAVKSTITKAPQIIIFHLKRFAWQGKSKRKLSTNICCPLSNLDVSPYISSHLCKGDGYNLCAVVKHHGRINCGHYIAFCKHLITKNWYRFDDEDITKITDDAVQTAKAYLLFYTCKGCL